MVLRCFLKISRWFIQDIAGSLSLKAHGCDRFWAVASYKGRNPETFGNQFFAFKHHLSAISKERQLSSQTLFNISDNTKFVSFNKSIGTW